MEIIFLKSNLYFSVLYFAGILSVRNIHYPIFPTGSLFYAIMLRSHCLHGICGNEGCSIPRAETSNHGMG